MASKATSKSVNQIVKALRGKMRRWAVTQVTAEEYAKAAADANYGPLEYVAGEILARTEVEAWRILRREKAAGKWDRSASLGVDDVLAGGRRVG